MPRLTIDGREIEAAAGTTVLQAALDNGIHIQHFCWHPDLSVDGNCRTCMVEVEKAPKLQIACNTPVAEGMVVHTKSPQAVAAQRSALEFLLVNHPIDCPVCDQAGECSLQDNYMRYGLHESRTPLEAKIRKRKMVDLGPIVLDAERCVLCSRCLRFEREVTGTNQLEFRERGGHVQIASYQDRPVTHDYAGNLADVCPVGALLSHDFRFRMRVWFLTESPSVCPGCSTGCNVFVDHRDGDVYRLRPRRNVEVNRSWMCDHGRREARALGAPSRLVSARARGPEGWRELPVSQALDDLGARLREAGAESAFLATPQATNEDLFVFRALADQAKGLLDFRVGHPEARVRVREDAVLLRADRNPNTQGCLDLGLGRSGVEEILAACGQGRVRVALLQGPELLREEAAREAVARVPLVVVMATHDEPALASAHLVLPAAAWAEADGTFANFQRRVQRLARAVPPPGEATPRWELANGLLLRLGRPVDAATPGDVFALLAAAVPGYLGLDHASLGAAGRALPLDEPGGSGAGPAGTA